MQRVLDLGCGPGDSWRKLGMAEQDWQLVGIDVSTRALQIARETFGPRGWRYLLARGEQIPLADECVDGIFCNVALPYMHIPRTIAELHRVLVPGGWFRASLHRADFTWSEFRNSFPHPKRSMFRVFVLLNGMLLHCAGRVMSLQGTCESCQTERGMRMALQKAGFEEIHFRHEGRRFFVEARRDQRATRAGAAGACEAA
jgi:ubiquinone/menaquinone biosynthesis C-methylase UbiE